ncbi:AsmA-like C-terminal domain-containing protein [Candidatus Odyssella thessalonicensis]|uniref:YhdP family protein n=1 Tax=Candidatus Odyssella thessalonicensis TaxID=84647 RepID=UPI000225B1BC|nr:AsmA-like C-terminal domain-containing protein [Candidatus Odyssella thessalonicensis]
MDNLKKTFKIIILSLLMLILALSSISYYLSSKNVQRTLAGQFTRLLEHYHYYPEDITIGETRWAGLRSPLSIKLNGVVIKNQKYEATIKYMQLGISLRRLLLLSPTLKRLTVEKAVLKRNDEPIAELSGSISLEEPAFSYRLKELTGNLKDMAPLIPQLAIFEAIDLPVTLTSSGSYDGRLGINGHIYINAKQGTVTLPAYFPHVLTITQAEAQARLSPKKLALTDVRFRSDALEAHISGEVEAESLATALNQQQPVTISIKGHLTTLAIDKIDTYWPKPLGVKARRWITTNLSQGHISQATLQLKGQANLTPDPAFKVDSLAGNIDVEGVTVAYLGDLPPVTNACGHCSYSKSNLIIAAQGVCNDLSIDQAHLNISNLDQDDEHMDIDLTIQGKLESALALMARKPLQLPQKLSLDHTLFKGIATTRLKLSFPLQSDLPLDRVRANAYSQIVDAKLVTDILEPFISNPLTKGKFDLHVTNDHLKLIGTGLVANHPARISATESFADHDSQVTIQANDNAADPYLGSFGLEYHNGAILLDADLSKTEYAISWLRFIKEAGQPGNLVINAERTEDNSLAINSLNLVLGETHLQGKGKIKPASGIDLFLETLQIGPLKGKLLIKGTPDKITLGGALERLDLDPIIQELSEETEDLPHNFKAAANLRINNVMLGSKLSFGKVETSLTWEDGKISSLAMDSLRPGVLKLHIAPLKNNQQYFSLFCHNAGDLIDYFMPNNDFEGGALNFVGNISESDKKTQIQGELDLRQVTVIKAPLLAKILSLSSLDGIFSTLSGKGIYFDHIMGKIQWRKDELKLDDIHASGSSIALNFNGVIDIKDQIYDLKGEFYPLNSINLLMANIPVIGSFLSGDKKRGVFSTTFTVKGSKNSPAIQVVNPLATITPQGVKKFNKPAAQQEAVNSDSPQVLSPTPPVS